MNENTFTFNLNPKTFKHSVLINISSAKSFLLRYFLIFTLILSAGFSTAFSQVIYQPNNLAQIQQPNNNYLANSNTFRQEIARMEINVMRQGAKALPITQVPRLEANDVLKVKLSEDPINGMRPDQSNWDWTFLVAFINPARNNDSKQFISEEIHFRKTGWYKEYLFTVPYDSQPIFFLYPKPKYRDKILKLVSQNQEEIRKIGEKTIELSDAYAKIGSFLSELQTVIYHNQYYGNYGGYGNYGYNTYNPYNTYNNIYGNTTTPNNTFNRNMFMNQLVERLARSFNVQLPNCWGGGYPNGGNIYGQGGYNNGYYNGGYNNGMYNNGYNGGYNNSYGGGYGLNGYGIGNDFMNRVQCIAKSVKLEDFDLSVSRLLQQGGILAASQLAQKYPQLAFWINIAAAAIDVILKITKKTPLKIVPTVISSNENGAQNTFSQPNNIYSPNQSFQQNPGMQQNFAQMPQNSFNQNGNNTGAVKISLYAESAPSESGFVTAYPLVINKWQANPDPDLISLPAPVLLDSCLHVGQNFLQSSDVLTDWMADSFTKDFKLLITSSNGFQKTFPLKKNIGLNGWELNLTREDLNSFPKINLTLESYITGKRGFNEIRSPKFDLPIPSQSSWEVTAESQKLFSVGGKRFVTLKNQFGNCKCLQSVVYKPAFGGQFIFEANNKENPILFSDDGKEASFEIDTSKFHSASGQLELRQVGSDPINLNLNLYPAAPEITDFRVSKGDKNVVITGYGLEQIKAVKINNKRAIPSEEKVINSETVSNPPSTINPPVIEETKTSATPAPIKTTGNNQSNGTVVSNPGNNSSVQLSNPNLKEGTDTKAPAVVMGVNPDTLGNNPLNTQTKLPVQPNTSQTNPVAETNNQTVQFKPVQKILSEKIFVFDDSSMMQEVSAISLELELEGNRTYVYPKSFNVALARPAIAVSIANEIEAVAMGSLIKAPFDFTYLPIFPIDSTTVSVSVQNVLTDYDFKVENIQIETRIENSQVTQNELPKADFEILDWKNMIINFNLNGQTQRYLPGRRLQFRILDKLRGNSNWITLKNKFVRVPEITSVKCAKVVSENCILRGKGIEYISQVSVDGGKNWYPELPATLSAKPESNGEKTAAIPYTSNTKNMLIRLRDFYNAEGIKITLAPVKSKN